MPQGFYVRFPENLFENNRQFAKTGLKLIWRNWRYWFKGHHEIFILGMTIEFDGGLDPLSFILLPFTLLHESLHFILLYLSKNRHVVRLGPGLFEAFYLTLTFVIFLHNVWIAFFLLFIDNFQLMRNLSGDFQPYLHKKRKHPHNPEP